MSDTQTQPWSDNPNAPKIPYNQYFAEKAGFAGLLIASILYGILVILFFQCMVALLCSANRKRECVKWGLVLYSMAMFSCATIVIGTAQNIASISFIDNREFPGGGAFPSGPLGYQSMICSKAPGIAPGLATLLSYWLADGLLLYRCYVIYDRNLWATAFPCLMYLATIAMGIVVLATHSCGWGGVSFTLPHLSISVSLNTTLTLMIVTRLVLYGRHVRTATGSQAGISGLYKTIATMLIESSALYALNSLLLIGLWAAGNAASGIFLPTLSQTQVIAPLLIIQRVANRSALTSNTIVTGHIDSFRDMGREESTGGNPGFPRVLSVSSADNSIKNAGELGNQGDETKTNLHWGSEA